MIMKLFLLPAVFIFCCLVNSNAQNMPNGGFENWTSFGFYEQPDSWNTTDSVSLTQGSHSATKETSDIHGGLYALRLFPFNSIIGTIPGVASNGRLNTATLTFIGGTIDTVRHQTLNGWYKYSPVSNDSCTVNVSLFKWNGPTKIIIATGVFGTSAATSVYTPFSITLNYATTDRPDSMLVSVYSSALGASHIGTVLLVDDFSFSGVVSGINDPSASVQSIHVYPVPAVNTLSVRLDMQRYLHTSFEISDLTGKRVLEHQMNSLSEDIDIHELSNGNYLYHLLDENGNRLSTGKFSISR
jgi:hypothetical protein